MKIKAGFRIESDVMQSLSRSGYSSELLREKEAKFREKYMNQDLENPNQIFSEGVRKNFEPDVKIEKVAGVIAPENAFQPTKVGPLMLERMEVLVNSRYPMPEGVPRSESAFWVWAKKKKESFNLN